MSEIVKEIKKGESAFFPLGTAQISLTAKCHCGGEMIPHSRKVLTWVCNRSHWWNRRRGHAYLQGSIQVLPAPKGEA